MSEAPNIPLAAAPPTFADKVAKSSQVCFVDYNAQAQELSVIFRGSPGKRYVYIKFPPDAWLALKTADSIGSFLYRNVTRPMPGDNKPPYEFKMVVLPAGDPLPAQPAEVP